MIPLIYCRNRNIINFSHTRVEYVSLLPMHYENPLKPMDQKLPPPKPPLLLGKPGPPSNTPMPGHTLLIAPNGSSIASWTFVQLCYKVPTGYNGMPLTIPQNCLFHWGDLHCCLLASSLDPADPPTQTASRSNQLSFHNPPDRPTDRPTNQ